MKKDISKPCFKCGATSTVKGTNVCKACKAIILTALKGIRDDNEPKARQFRPTRLGERGRSRRTPSGGYVDASESEMNSMAEYLAGHE